MGGVFIGVHPGETAGPDATLYFGDWSGSEDRAQAIAALDNLAAAVLTARQLLTPDAPRTAYDAASGTEWPAGQLQAQPAPQAVLESRWCVDVDPADRHAWAVYAAGQAGPVSTGLTLSAATELVERLAGEAWAGSHPESQAHPGRLPLREGDGLPRLAYPPALWTDLAGDETTPPVELVIDGRLTVAGAEHLLAGLDSMTPAQVAELRAAGVRGLDDDDDEDEDGAQAAAVAREDAHYGLADPSAPTDGDMTGWAPGETMEAWGK